MKDKNFALVLAFSLLVVSIITLTARVVWLERDVAVLAKAVTDLADASLATSDTIRNLAGLPKR